MKVIVVKEASDIPVKPVDGLPTVVYWNTLGVAQSIRLALAAAGVEFCDVRIEAGDPNNSEEYKANWFSVKSNMPLAFPNLPYFMDGEVCLSHSNTILRYIGRKWDCMGAPPEHLHDLILDELTDLEWAIIDHAYYKGPESLYNWYKTKVPTALSRFEAQLVKSNGFLLGSLSKPTIADVKLYVFLYKLQVIQSHLGSNETKGYLVVEWVRTFISQMESSPGIAKYLSSPNYMKSPMNNPAAKWIG